MCKLSTDNKKKLGNIMVYIAQKCKNPCKTKVLKLLYLMEERWVVIAHTPFTGLPFEVWQHGPVEKDVFIELSNEQLILKDYVTMCNNGESTYMKAVADFDEDEFSDIELRMMEDVIKKYGAKSASELVAITHKKGSLWYREAEEHKLLEAFKNFHSNSSNVEIDFSKLLSACDAEFYKEALSTLKIANYYGA